MNSVDATLDRDDGGLLPETRRMLSICELGPEIIFLYRGPEKFVLIDQESLC